MFYDILVPTVVRLTRVPSSKLMTIATKCADVADVVLELVLFALVASTLTQHFPLVGVASGVRLVPSLLPPRSSISTLRFVTSERRVHALVASSTTVGSQ